jgi:thiamine pyrophosphate-dependent acetolactate synthase large subunit-like protein
LRTTRQLPADAVICNGAGNFSIWVHRYWRYRRYGGQLAPISGSMGYGVPAAIGMKRLAPERPVVAFAGDGDFLMTGQEFATAVQYDLPVIVVVVDNGMYGTIRMHQEREYPGRVSGTELKNPDFAAYARAFGGHGELVETTDQFAPAFERARDRASPRSSISIDRGAHPDDVAHRHPREGRQLGDFFLYPPTWRLTSDRTDRNGRVCAGGRHSVPGASGATAAGGVR